MNRTGKFGRSFEISFVMSGDLAIVLIPIVIFIIPIITLCAMLCMDLAKSFGQANQVCDGHLKHFNTFGYYLLFMNIRGDFEKQRRSNTTLFKLYAIHDLWKTPPTTFSEMRVAPSFQLTII